ncbi:MAG: GxxExxY protein [Rhodospirillales bacterium]|nr:GxxExxY protein [Rhodospirillales bacterium]USO08531.1 MAG: GxxExxY protein [Rhodospirillales bacterium]
MEKTINAEVANDLLSRQVVDCIFHVHRNLGPGLLESVYEQCLAHTLRKRGLVCDLQKTYPLRFDDTVIDTGLRLDMVIENSIVVELKSIEKILPVHESQILTYLRLSGIQTGFLVNFNVPLIKDGLKRYVRSS